MLSIYYLAGVVIRLIDFVSKEEFELHEEREIKLPLQMIWMREKEEV